MSIKVRRTASGERRYDVRLRDSSGQEYSRTFRTRKEAERFQATERADRARGSWIDPRRSSTRFIDVAAEWLASHPTKKESSLARDESILRVHVLPAIGDTPVGQLTPVDVQRLVNGWAASLGPRTVRRQYAVLRAVFSLAVDTDRIGRSPCRKIKLPAERPVTHHIVSPGELKALAEAVGPDYEAMVYLAAILGLRWGECAGLRVKDVEFLARSVAVESQRTRGLHGRMIAGDPKWNSARTMAAPAGLVDLVAEHMRRRDLSGADPEAPLFVGPGGAPLHYSNWRRRVFLPACEKVGLAGLRFQALRTANTSAMVALDVNVKTAQARSGHKDAKTTLNIYARPSREADRAAAELLGRWFLGGSPTDRSDADAG
ncbi:MAG TPA: tyrosine-type recombinase/integrase [Acidimicrobiales bacterium]|nr:tyrosine-type recombinase/integrase [Acidimicrobiales bacterium]